MCIIITLFLLCHNVKVNNNFNTNNFLHNILVYLCMIISSDRLMDSSSNSDNSGLLLMGNDASETKSENELSCTDDKKNINSATAVKPKLEETQTTTICGSRIIVHEASSLSEREQDDDHENNKERDECNENEMVYPTTTATYDDDDASLKTEEHHDYATLQQQHSQNHNDYPPPLYYPTMLQHPPFPNNGFLPSAPFVPQQQQLQQRFPMQTLSLQSYMPPMTKHQQQQQHLPIPPPGLQMMPSYQQYHPQYIINNDDSHNGGGVVDPMYHSQSYNPMMLMNGGDRGHNLLPPSTNGDYGFHNNNNNHVKTRKRKRSPNWIPETSKMLVLAYISALKQNGMTSYYQQLKNENDDDDDRSKTAMTTTSTFAHGQFYKSLMQVSDNVNWKSIADIVNQHTSKEDRIYEPSSCRNKMILIIRSALHHYLNDANSADAIKIYQKFMEEYK